MAHLGHLLTALADGQLSPAVTEKVLEHVAVCRPCATELAAERRARRLLADSQCGGVPASLAERLRTIPAVPAPEPAALAPQRRAGALVAVGSLVGASALAATLFVVGAPRDVAPAYTDAAALASVGLVADEPEVTATLAGYRVVPQATEISPAFTVTAQGELQSGRGSVVELAGRGGHVVLATQAGRLDTRSVAHLEPVEHRGVALYVLDDEPFHAVWQSGSRVVELVTDLPAVQVGELVAHFPADEYDDGPLARIARGWVAVTGGSRT